MMSILCLTLHPRDHYFNAKHGTGVAIYKQPADSIVATLVAALPLNEAIRAVNDLNRASRERYDQAAAHLDVVLP